MAVVEFMVIEPLPLIDVMPSMSMIATGDRVSSFANLATGVPRYLEYIFIVIYSVGYTVTSYNQYRYLIFMGSKHEVSTKVPYIKVGFGNNIEMYVLVYDIW